MNVMDEDHARRARAAFEVLERDGYRYCDTPACNCGSFHRPETLKRGVSEFTCEWCGEDYPRHHKKCRYVTELARIEAAVSELVKCRCGVLLQPKTRCGSCGATSRGRR